MEQKKLSVKIGNVVTDSSQFLVMAGPCSIESAEQFQSIAQNVRQQGVSVLRGGLFKMRTNPDSFQGLGREAVDFVKQTKSQLDMSFISEIVDPRHISDLDDVVDVFQVGSRNMYNYALLKELGHLNKPVLLKRGFSATIDEWLSAAEYIEKGGNSQVMLCERGIRTFETKTRNTLDLNAVAWIKRNSHFPIIVDPSHGVGVKNLITDMAMAAAAVGADGIIVEVHNEPEKALSDGFQALNFKDFENLVHQLQPILKAVGRTMV